MKRKTFSIFIGLALFLSCLAPSVLTAQTTGSVSGVVKDETGDPLDAVRVTAQLVGTINAFEVFTDIKGRYSFTNLSPGKYKITAESTGYNPIVRPNITVRLGAKVNLDFILVQTMEVKEEVIVQADAPAVETTKVMVDENISFEQFKDIPTQGRDFNAIINTFAGVNRYNNDFNVLGSRSNQNNYLIDGMKNNMLGDDQTGGRGSYARALYGYTPTTGQAAEEYVQSLPGGALQKFNLDSIEEVQFSKSGYSAEYGQGSGAVFNMVTRSGTDKFKFGFTVNHQTHTINDWFVGEEDKSPYPMKRWQESLFLGGPIIRGKLRFFVSYERDDYDVGFDDRTITAGNLNLWVSDLDIWRSQAVGNHFTGKLTYEESPNSKYNMTLNYNRDASEYNNTQYKAPGDIDNRAGKDRGFSLLVNNQRQFESSLLNVSAKYTKLDRYTSREPVGDNLELRPARAEDEVDFGYWIRRFGAYGNDIDININSFQAKATYNMYLKDMAGDHNLIFGIDYEYFKQATTTKEFNYVAFINQSSSGFHPAQEVQPWYLWFLYKSNGADYQIPLSQAAAFVNEEWKINPSFTLSAGFRVDWDEFIDKVFFSPRIGFAWDPFGDGKTVVRGGVGLFRDRTDVLAYASSLFKRDSYTWFLDAGPFSSDPSDLGTWNRFLDPSNITSSYEIGNEYRVDPDLQPPITYTANIGFERDLIKGFVFRANYVYKKMDKLFYNERSNVYTVRIGDAWTRPDSTKPTIFTLKNAGVMTAHDIEFMLTKNFSGGSFINVSYVWEDTTGNAASSIGLVWFESNFNQSGESTQWVDERYPADFEVKHFFKATWSFTLPLDFIFSGFFQWRTGKPYHVYQQSYEPAYYVGWRLVEPPNSRRLPFFQTLDVRISKRFRIGGHRLHFFADVFNLLNRDNVLQVNGSVTRGVFEEPLSFDRPRQVQIGFRWEWN